MVRLARPRSIGAALKRMIAHLQATPAAIVPILASALVAGIVGIRLNISANNDVFLQILASEGLMRGQGYGFEAGEKSFYSIGSRATDTRWPPGITVLATGLRFITVDPLVTLARAQVLLAGITFYIVYLALFRQLNDRAVSLAVTSASLGTTAYFDWHTEVASEPLFMLALAILFLQLSLSGVQRRYRLLPCVWGLEMVRTAGAYISAGLGVVIFLAEKKQDPAKAFLKAALSAVLFLTPLIVFHAYYGLHPNEHHRIDVSLINQILRQIFWQHQILLPHTDWMKRHEFTGISLGTVCLLTSVYALWRFLRNGLERHRLAVAFVVLGLCYIAGLSLSSVLARYDWGVVYRVSAVSVILLSLGWWSIVFLLPAFRMYARVLILVAFAVAALKTGWYLSTPRSVSVQRDYRASVVAFQEFASKTRNAPILLCAETIADRNYARGVLYAAHTWWKPPVEILSAEFQTTGRGSDCARFVKDSGQWRWAGGTGGGPTIEPEASLSGRPVD